MGATAALTSLAIDAKKLNDSYDSRNNTDRDPLELRSVTDLIGNAFMLAGDTMSLFGNSRMDLMGKIYNAIGLGIKTYGLTELGNDTMDPKDFFDKEGWIGFAGDRLEAWSRLFHKYAVPDAFNPWLDEPNIANDLAKLFPEWTGLNRSGTHYIYDPLVLDLDGDGIETVGVNDETYEMVS